MLGLEAKAEGKGEVDDRGTIKGSSREEILYNHPRGWSIIGSRAKVLRVRDENLTAMNMNLLLAFLVPGKIF